MKDLKRQLQISIGIIAAAIAAASVAIYFFSNSIAAQADKIVSDRTRIAEENAAVGILASLKSEAAQAAPYAPVLESILPTHDKLVGLPQALNALGQSHNVSVSFAFQGVSAEATVSAPGSDDFSLIATGAPGDLVAFLNDLEAEASGFIIAIDSFDFASSGASYLLTAHGRAFSKGS
ncbi:MAG: hypothetical protein ABSE18_01615 [Minisyncoccia bacterium]|jgi:hypothetical protein